MPMSPWVLRLIIANVAMFFVAQPGSELAFWLRLVPADVPTRPWTLLTYMFLHGSPGHLIFNMLSLYFFGPAVERRLGSTHFFGLYTLSGIVSAGLSMLADFGSSVVGASGAVLGVMLVFAAYWPEVRILIWGIIPVTARMMVIIYVVASISGGLGHYIPFIAEPGTAHWGHLGGIIGGWLYLQWMGHRSPLREYRRKLEGKKTPTFGRAVGGALGAALGTDDELTRWSAIPREGLHEVNREEVDRLVAKAQQHGVRSLTFEERSFLDRMATR